MKNFNVHFRALPKDLAFNPSVADQMCEFACKMLEVESDELLVDVRHDSACPCVGDPTIQISQCLCEIVDVTFAPIRNVTT